MNQPTRNADDDTLFLPEYYRDLTVLHLIGRGRSSKVYLVENPVGKKAALKVTMCTTPRLTNSAIREYAFLQRLSGSSRVLEGYDFRLESSPRGIMTAWLLEESAQVLSADDPTLTAWDRLAVGVSVCEAMIDCRRKGIAHLDIKQSNVFHGLDGVWKVGDFSHSARSNHLGRLHTAVGSPGYMAPEVYTRHCFSQQSEIYSTGVLLYRLFAGSMPFKCDAARPCRSEDESADRAGLSEPLWRILENPQLTVPRTAIRLSRPFAATCAPCTPVTSPAPASSAPSPVRSPRIPSPSGTGIHCRGPWATPFPSKTVPTLPTGTPKRPGPPKARPLTDSLSFIDLFFKAESSGPWDRKTLYYGRAPRRLRRKCAVFAL